MPIISTSNLFKDFHFLVIGICSKEEIPELFPFLIALFVIDFEVLKTVTVFSYMLSLN